ncbi:MAG: thymidylate synthase [Nitrososphaeria archaeon]|nr:thymidylate synthase [Nitrososphaeria archaeon]NIQ32074.1 thymidylate synthase [Nitrososphaeria archaeon]
MFGDEFAERVIGNLCNLSTFCISCDLACDYCRTDYGSYASDIYGAHEVPKNLPFVIEEPRRHLPKNMPNCDMLVAVGLHPDLLLATPDVAAEAHMKGVIVPIEDRRWCPPGLQNQLEERLNALGLEYAFPKPFCVLDETGQPTIDQFVRTYKIGKPLLEIDITNDTISDARVIRSAPCGSTWYVARQIRWTKISNIEDTVAKSHHSYPCTASMQVDPELGEPILHLAGYTIRNAVKHSLRQAALKK